MKTPAVQDFCLAVWELRERPVPPDEWTQHGMGRNLYQAIAKDMETTPGYDPECDHRVRWVREVMRLWREGKAPVPDADLEAIAAMLLGKDLPVVACGKDLGAGGS